MATGIVTVVVGGKTLTFTQDKLSEDDVQWLKENGSKAAPSSSGGGATIGALPDVLLDPDGEEADMSKPVQVYILLGQSNMLGFGSPASLKAATAEGKYPSLVDEEGNWTVRKNVRNVRVN